MAKAFVIDNSIVMTWCFRDEPSPLAETVLDRLVDAAAHVPSIWPFEVVNVLLVAERLKLISEADGIRFIELLTRLPIVVESEGPGQMMKDLLSLARTHRLSSYDAAYLDLAIKKGLPLATADEKLRQAAAAVRVPLVRPDR